MIVTVMWAPSWSIAPQALRVRLMIVMTTRSQRREADPEPAKTTWRVSLMQRYAGKVFCENSCLFLSAFLLLSFHEQNVFKKNIFNRFIKAYKKFGSPLERWAYVFIISIINMCLHHLIGYVWAINLSDQPCSKVFFFFLYPGWRPSPETLSWLTNP